MKSTGHQITIKEAMDVVEEIHTRETAVAAAYGRGDCKMLAVCFQKRDPTFRVYGHGILDIETDNIMEAVSHYNAVPLRSNDDAQG